MSVAPAFLSHPSHNPTCTRGWGGVKYDLHAISRLGLLGGNKEPPYRDQETETSSDAKRTRGPNLVQQGTASETAQEEKEDGQDLVVARGDETTKVEQLRFSHELTPRRGEDDCGMESVAETCKRREKRTGGGKLGVETFAHDAL